MNIILFVVTIHMVTEKINEKIQESRIKKINNAFFHIPKYNIYLLIFKIFVILSLIF